MSSQLRGRGKSAPSRQPAGRDQGKQAPQTDTQCPVMAMQQKGGAGNDAAKDALNAEVATPEREAAPEQEAPTEESSAVAQMPSQGGQDLAEPPEPEWAKPLEDELASDPVKMGKDIEAEVKGAEEESKAAEDAVREADNEIGDPAIKEVEAEVEKENAAPEDQGRSPAERKKLAAIEAQKEQAPGKTEEAEKGCDPFDETINLLKAAIALLMMQMMTGGKCGVGGGQEGAEQAEQVKEQVTTLITILCGIPQNKRPGKGGGRPGGGKKGRRPPGRRPPGGKNKPPRGKKPPRDKDKPPRDKEPPGGGDKCKPGDGEQGLKELKQRPRHVKHRDSKVVRTGGGFIVEFKIPEIIIYRKCGKKITRIWGDPHVDGNGDGKDDWHFGKDSTFVLPDGSKLCLDTEPNQNDEWYVVGADLLHGSDRFHLGKGDGAGMKDDAEEWDETHADADKDPTAGVFALGADGDWAKADMQTGGFNTVQNESWAQYQNTRDVTGGREANGQINEAQKRAIFGNRKQHLQRGA